MRKRDAWWLKPLRMMRRDYISDFSEFIGADLDALAREAKERWHVNVEWVMATPGCAPGMAHYTLFNSDKFEKLPGVGDFDLIREYLPHARKYGIHLLPYVNMHWYSYEFAAAHPGWEQLLADGTPYGRKHPLYGGGTTFCINSPWREWAGEMIREVMRTGVDGCFLDGPVIFPDCCYCEHCREQFARAAGGAKLPAPGALGDPHWRKFLEFRADSWARFMRDAQRAAREIKADAVISLNGGSFNSSNPLTARDTGRMERFQSFTGAEEFFHCKDDYASPFQTLNLSRFLSAGARPGLVFTHHALSTWHYAPLPPAEMATALAQSVAGGSNTWFAVFMAALKASADTAFAGVEGMGAFLEEIEPWTDRDETAAETAMLISNRTLYYYVSRHRGLCRDVGGGREENLVVDGGGKQSAGILTERRRASADILDRELPGCLDACNYAHIPLRVLWDEHLAPEKLKGVKTLILPNAACLSRRQVGEIKKFVERGGGLVAAFESGMYDQWGEPAARTDWLRFLGISSVEGVFTPSRVEDYLTITGSLDGLPKSALVPRPVNALKVRPARNAEVMACYNNPIGLSYLPLNGLSEYPAVLLSRRGKGRVVYLASPLFESFDRFHMDCHRDLARAAIRLAGGRRGLQVETDAPGSLAVEVRRQKGRLMVHLVNATADMKRPMGRIIPLRDVTLTLRCARATRARCLRSGKRLRLRRTPGRVTFGVPVVRDYEVIVIE